MFKEDGLLKSKETHQIGFEDEGTFLQTKKEDNSDECVKEGKIKTGNKEYEKEDNSDECVKEGKIKTGNKEYETDKKQKAKRSMVDWV